MTKPNGMLKPLFNKVLLRREAFTHSTLHIPQSSQRAHARCKGEVVAIGPDVNEHVKVKMIVIFGAHAGTWLDDEGRLNPEGELFICYDEDILCEVESDGTRAGSSRGR